MNFIKYAAYDKKLLFSTPIYVKDFEFIILRLSGPTLQLRNVTNL